MKLTLMGLQRLVIDCISEITSNNLICGDLQLVIAQITTSSSASPEGTTNIQLGYITTNDKIINQIYFGMLPRLRTHIQEHLGTEEDGAIIQAQTDYLNNVTHIVGYSYPGGPIYTIGISASIIRTPNQIIINITYL